MSLYEEPLCRFCFEGPIENNPLVDPCNCIGSMKYVHIQCIRTWKATTTNPVWIDKCQLCLSPYITYLRWPKELYPHETPLLQFLVHKHIAVTTFLYYTHLTILSFYPILRKYFYGAETITRLLRSNSTIESLYFTPTSHIIYLLCLTSVTCMYIYVYKKAIFDNVQNKRLYALLWFSCITEEGIFQTPIMTQFALFITAAFSIAFILPFSFFYIYTLSSIYTIHISIIRQINARAEIF